MKKFKFLKVFVVALVALTTLGCGDSNNDFVGVNPVNPDSTGGLYFQFHRTDSAAAQTTTPFNVNTPQVGNVPWNTDYIGFSFYEDAGYQNEWAGWSGQTFPFAAGQSDLGVSISGVPTSVHFAVAIAYSADGIPLAAIYSPEFNVIAGYNDLPIPLGGDSYKPFSIQDSELTVADVNLDITNTTGNVSLTNVVATLDVSATFGDGTTSVSADIPHSLVNVTGVNEAIATYLDGEFTGVSFGSYDFTITYAGATGTATLTVTDKTIISANFKGAIDNDNGISWGDLNLEVDDSATLLFDIGYADGTSATDTTAVGYDVIYAAGYRVYLRNGGSDTDGAVALTANASGATISAEAEGSNVLRLFAPGTSPDTIGDKPVSALGVEVGSTNNG